MLLAMQLIHDRSYLIARALAPQAAASISEREWQFPVS